MSIITHPLNATRFSRQVLALRPGQTLPSYDTGRAISSVFTPPRFRNKGYARRFMSQLHAALAPQCYPDLRTLASPAHSESIVSVLYSSVGDFYSSCTPSAGELGWTIQRSLKTSWALSDIKQLLELGEAEQSTIPLLSGSDVAATLSLDDHEISADLLERQKIDPSATYFAFAPTAPLNSLPMTLSMLVDPSTRSDSSDVAWGARIPDSGEFVTWVYLHGTARTLSITRLRASTISLAWLLRAAAHAAEKTKCESIEAWNVPEHLASVVKATGGDTFERQENLSAFKWYGKQPGETGKVVWALDER